MGDLLIILCCHLRWLIGLRRRHRTWQQAEPDKFGEGDEEGLRRLWDEAREYMEEHGLGGDKG
eukprot:1075172-Karenia_brevis.AAC.1